MAHSYNLDRFLHAQRDTYERALLEIHAGQKRTHWMWFIFPQIAGLGSSATAQHYAINSLAEAKAYLSHPILGERLREITRALQSLPDTAAETVFGNIDAMKLRSSLTLFSKADENSDLFQEALTRWFGGTADEITLERL